MSPHRAAPRRGRGAQARLFFHFCRGSSTCEERRPGGGAYALYRVFPFPCGSWFARLRHPLFPRPPAQPVPLFSRPLSPRAPCFFPPVFPRGERGDAGVPVGWQASRGDVLRRVKGEGKSRPCSDREKRGEHTVHILPCFPPQKNRERRATALPAPYFPHRSCLCACALSLFSLCPFPL